MQYNCQISATLLCIFFGQTGFIWYFLSVQGIKCYKGVTTDGISSMPSQKTERNCTEGVTQCLKSVLYYLPSGYISPKGN